MENKALLLGLVLFFIGVAFAFLSGFGIFYLLDQDSSLKSFFGLQEPTTVQREEELPEQEGFLEEESTPSVEPESPAAIPSAEQEGSLEVCEDWISYTNSRYNYRFSYNPDWMFNNDMPGSLKDERIVLQGDISEKGWPSIGINSQEFETEPETIAELKAVLEDTWGGTASLSEIEFGKNNIPAVEVTTEDSPQAYAISNYYFIHDGEYLLLSFNDISSSEAQQIYNCFLQEFETL
ncbi:MAG: hypothetical protein U9M98_03770 [Patescibacteria group bacterium]|nr:hypothetical protein [Patescibacteria group bacterium]